MDRLGERILARSRRAPGPVRLGLIRAPCTPPAAILRATAPPARRRRQDSVGAHPRHRPVVIAKVAPPGCLPMAPADRFAARSRHTEDPP